MSEKVEKIKQQLTAYRAELSKYKKLFMEDGVIDQKEQDQLDSMNAVINECEQKLDSMLSKKKEINGNSSDSVQSNQSESDEKSGSKTKEQKIKELEWIGDVIRHEIDENNKHSQ